MSLLVRTEGEPLGVLPALRAAIRRVDPHVPLFAVTTLEHHLATTLVQERLITILLAFAASLAVVLAAVGLYGLLAYSVSQRTGELGIRLALGAARPRLLAMVVGEGMRLAAVGLALGVVVSLVGARLVQGFLFEIRGTDPGTLLGVVILLVAVALLASYLPARRATRVDPVQALRSD